MTWMTWHLHFAEHDSLAGVLFFATLAISGGIMMPLPGMPDTDDLMSGKSSNIISGTAMGLASVVVGVGLGAGALVALPIVGTYYAGTMGRQK